MVRFFCFPTPTAQHRLKKGSLPVDETMMVISQMNSQDQTGKSTTESGSPNQKTDENNHLAVSGQYNTSPSSHQECWRSLDLNRYLCSDDGQEVMHLKKSQSLGNMLEKNHKHHCSEGAECDVIDHDAKCHCSNFKSNTAVEESSDHAVNSEGHTTYAQPRFPRSQSVVFQNNSSTDLEESAESQAIGRRCRSFERLCSTGDEKVDYFSGDEACHSKSNLDVHCTRPSSPDVYEALHLEENASEGRSDAAEEGQHSTASGEENYVGDEILGHKYWSGKYICRGQSLDPVSPFCADLRDACRHSDNDDGLNESIDQERKQKLWNRDRGHHRQSLLVDVPDSKKMCDSKDISEEAGQSETEITVNPHFNLDLDELTPRTFNIKRIEDWINQIDIENGMVVEEQGESSTSSSTKYTEPVAGAAAVRSDVKSPPGMEMAYTYISKLTSASSSAQLSNLGLVAIPILSAFSGLRLLNLSGNSIVRITTGALPKGLHMLSLSKNNIGIIEGLRELTRLRVLDISYNRISRIGHGLASCSSLKELYLAGNKISEVDGLHRLLKLKVLDMRNNKISTAKGLGQLAANYNSLEAINLDCNPAQKNVGDEHLKKYLQGLLPNLAVYNKHSIRAIGSKEVSDRHTRKISSSHRSDRSVRSERKPSRLVTGTTTHRSQSSRHGHSAYTSSLLLKPSRTRNMPVPLLGSKPTEYANAGDQMK